MVAGTDDRELSSRATQGVSPNKCATAQGGVPLPVTTSRPERLPVAIPSVQPDQGPVNRPTSSRPPGQTRYLRPRLVFEDLLRPGRPRGNLSTTEPLCTTLDLRYSLPSPKERPHSLHRHRARIGPASHNPGFRLRALRGVWPRYHIGCCRLVFRTWSAGNIPLFPCSVTVA